MTINKPAILKGALLVLLGAGIAAGGVVGGFFWLTRPIAPTPEPLTLTQLTAAHVGRRIQLHADTAGTLVKWQVLTGPTPDNYDLWSQDALQHDENFTTPVAGDYRVQAIAVVSGEAYSAEIHVLVDVGPTPIPPGPTPPTPPSPIPPGQLRVLMTFDEDAYQTDTAAQKVLNDTSIRNYIRSKNGSAKFVSNKVAFTDEPEMKPWKDAFTHQKALGITIFNGQNGQVVYEGPLPKTVDEAMKLLQQYGG